MCPVTVGSPALQRTKSRYAPTGAAGSPVSSVAISTLYETPSAPSKAAGRACTAM